MKRGIITSIIISIIVLNIAVIYSQSSSVTFTYDFNKTIDTDPEELRYISSALLVIRTTQDTTCKYTQVNGETPSNPFDTNYGIRHEKELNNLADGLHKYYIQCNGNNSSPIMEVSFRTKSPISANLHFSKEDPLKDGTYDIILTTSQDPINKPILEYSYDGIVYNPIPLTGSGKNWKGNIIITPSVGETICSFKFKATGLDGKEGTKITGKSVLEIDTKPPATIINFDATGYKGYVELEWLEQEDVEKYNIYKSTETGVGYNDFVDETQKESFTDYDVDDGKTYYYRIAAQDKAGNIGALSREIEATALLNENQLSQNSGLKPSLFGKVDNLVTEINLIIEDINDLKTAVSSKTQTEKEIFEDLKLGEEYTKAIAELESIKKDVERYKQQDLSESELDTKLNAARLRVDIIKKRIPESVTIISETVEKKDLSQNTIEEIVLEYAQSELTENEIQKTVTSSLDLIEEQSITIDSSLKNIEITYIDGTKDEKVIIKDNIQHELSSEENKKIVLVIPKDIAQSASDLEFKENDYEIIKDDPVIAFNANKKEIVYILEKHISTAKISDILIAPIYIQREEEKKSLITGNTISNLLEMNYTYIGYIVLGIVLLLLLLYFFKMKRGGKNKKVSKIKELVKIAKEFKKDENKKELEKIYSEIKEEYKSLSKEEKKKVYSHIKKLHKK